MVHLIYGCVSDPQASIVHEEAPPPQDVILVSIVMLMECPHHGVTVPVATSAQPTPPPPRPQAQEVNSDHQDKK
jgi:hypothetical protein